MRNTADTAVALELSTQLGRGAGAAARMLRVVPIQVPDRRRQFRWRRWATSADCSECAVFSGEVHPRSAAGQPCRPVASTRRRRVGFHLNFAMVPMFQQFSRGRIRQLAILAVVGMLGGISWWLQAQDNSPPGYEAYPLMHAQAADVNTQLQKLLADAGVPQDILVDRQGNRILVRGPEATQRLAAQLLTTLDRPAKPAGVAEPSSAPTLVRGYVVPTGSLDDAVDRLRKLFPPSSGVRIARTVAPAS